uniref:Homeobox even-skipped homolog protein 2 n=1 Tax=Drosophila rhopaloa TaxID=1041015 RepID=A0A6P4EIU8_DRORH
MGDFDLNVDSLIQRLLENFKKQKEAEEHAQKLLIAQQLAAAGGAAAAVATASAAAAAAAVSASSPTISSSYSALAASFGSGYGSGSGSGSGSGWSGSGAGAGSSHDPLEELTEQQRRLLQQYSISPPSETMISADGDQITVHHPREEPKKSRLKLRDFFVAEFGITT